MTRYNYLNVSKIIDKIFKKFQKDIIISSTYAFKNYEQSESNYNRILGAKKFGKICFIFEMQILLMIHAKCKNDKNDCNNVHKH